MRKGPTKSQEAPMISIVDDDKSFREATRRLMRLMGYGVSLFASAVHFLQFGRIADSSSLIVAIHVAGLGGTEVQHRLVAEGDRTLMTFVSALANETIEP